MIRKMINLAILSLIRTTVPSGLWFSQFGIAQKVLLYKWNTKGANFQIQIAAINGVWGFATSMFNKTYGNGGGLSEKYDFRYNSFSECLECACNKIVRDFGDTKLKLPLPKSMDDFTIKDPYHYEKTF